MYLLIINISFKDKRKFEDNQIENSFNEGMVKFKIFIYNKYEWI